MKMAAIGALVATGLVWVSLGIGADRHQAAVPSGKSDSFGSGGELIASTTPIGDNRQQLVIIDPRARVMSVYHIEAPTGKIELKSVRNISWDLQMVEFNGTSPLPREVRTMVEPR